MGLDRVVLGDTAVLRDTRADGRAGCLVVRVVHAVILALGAGSDGGRAGPSTGADGEGAPPAGQRTTVSRPVR